MLTLALFCYSAGQQCGGRPGPAGDWDPELGPQTAPPAGHTAAAQGQYTLQQEHLRLTLTKSELSNLSLL